MYILFTAICTYIRTYILHPTQVIGLKQQLKESYVQAAREREHLTKIYEQKLSSLQLTLEERSHEVGVSKGVSV